MRRSLIVGLLVLLALPATAQHPTVLNSFHAPVRLDQAEFEPNGALRSADVSNSGEHTITAIQFGCFVRRIDGEITTVVGRSNPIRRGMQPGDRLVFGRQLMSGGTDDAIGLYYFIAQVTYEDGTTWKAPLESLRHQIYMKNENKKRPLTPA